MVYLVPFLRSISPSQGCGQTAGSESRSALTGPWADVHRSPARVARAEAPTLRRLTAYASPGAAGDVGLSDALRCSQPSQGDLEAPTLRRLVAYESPGAAGDVGPSVFDILKVVLPQLS